MADASTPDQASAAAAADTGAAAPGAAAPATIAPPTPAPTPTEPGAADPDPTEPDPTEPTPTDPDAAGPATSAPTQILAAVRRRVPPRLLRILVAAGIALAGAALGAALAPATTAEVGPLQAEVRVVPSLDPGVHLLLPPAGEVTFETHDAPVALEARVARVDLDGARTLINSPAQLRALGDTAPGVLRGAAVRAALLTTGCCLAGAVGLSLLVHRRAWRRTAHVACTVVGALVVTAGLAATTADPDRLAQPRFTGLLSQAPYIAGEVPGVLARLETYRSGLSDIVRSVTSLYATTGQLPELAPSAGNGAVTVLHVSDIHLNPLAFDLIDKVVAQFGVDLVIDTGDITTWGTDVETATLSRIRQVGVPYVFVRGNHDSARTEAAVAGNPNAVVLDDEVAEVAGLVIAGIGDPVFTPDGDDAPRAAQGPSAPAGSAMPGSGDEALPPLGPATDPHQAAYGRLATSIRTWNAAHPDRPVQLAAVHEPVELEPLLGSVPLLLAGHTHKRDARLDASGTRVFVEGSTGGAGITASGLERLSDGKPLPLATSLIHVATTGDRAGQVIAVDAITVGGFGLTSVSLERTLIREEERPPPVVTPSPGPFLTPGPSLTPGPPGPTAQGSPSAGPVAGARP